MWESGKAERILEFILNVSASFVLLHDTQFAKYNTHCKWWIGSKAPTIVRHHILCVCVWIFVYLLILASFMAQCKRTENIIIRHFSFCFLPLCCSFCFGEVCVFFFMLIIWWSSESVYIWSLLWCNFHSTLINMMGPTFWQRVIAFHWVLYWTNIMPMKIL